MTILEYKGWSQQTLGYDILEDTTFNEETEVLEITVEKPVESNTNLKTEVDKVINEINRRLPWLIKMI